MQTHTQTHTQWRWGVLSSVSWICNAAAAEMRHRCRPLHSQQDHLNAPAAQGAQLRHDGCAAALLTRMKRLQRALRVGSKISEAGRGPGDRMT